jgi:hypothetical protein
VAIPLPGEGAGRGSLVCDPAPGRVGGLRAARHPGWAACEGPGALRRGILAARLARQGARPLSLGSTAARARELDGSRSADRSGNRS